MLAEAPRVQGKGITAKQQREQQAQLAAGEIDIAIGTHALISKKTVFKSLGLAVIDEQHKFGVEQRASLQARSSPAPHVLTMSATPIPRTLSLVAYGDMALTVIDELPPGRLPITTSVLFDDPDSRKEMYWRMRSEIEAGGRVYIVCPFVETSTARNMEDVAAAESEFDRLVEDGLFAEGEMGLLHGRLSPEEKAATIAAFSRGDTPVLVATTVVEVGVDVPEASVIVVEAAERFGLAQLHQLRGRVGRGSRASHCYLVTPEQRALFRLRILERSQDGFQIAQADLEHRGAGEVLGRKQSGAASVGCLRAASLPRDQQLLEMARADAMSLLQSYGMDPDNWPPALLSAMRYRELPALDIVDVPQNSLTAHDAALGPAV